METNSLARYVLKTMWEKGLSSSDVERQSSNEITQSYVNRIKNGFIQNPSTIKQKALAKGLGVPVSEISALINIPSEMSQTSKIVAAYVNELPEGIQSDVLITVKDLYEKYSYNTKTVREPETKKAI
jgi:transcriptional regulator with XRE-family HTH domain